MSKYQSSGKASTQPNTAKKSDRKYVTPKKILRVDNNYYTPKLKRYQKLDDGSVGNVRVVMRRKNQRDTDQIANHLFDLLSDGKVVSLLSFKKVYRENDKLKKQIKQQNKQINKLKRTIGRLNQELENSKQNQISLVNQLTDFGKANEDLNQQLNAVYADLEHSIKSNEELVERTETLQKIQKELLLKFEQQAVALKAHEEQLRLKDLLLTELRKKFNEDKGMMIKEIDFLNLRSIKLTEDNTQLTEGFVEQSKVIDQNSLQITALMRQNEGLERNVIDKSTALNSLNQETMRLQNHVVDLSRSSFYLPPPLLANIPYQQNLRISMQARENLARSMQQQSTV